MRNRNQKRVTETWEKITKERNEREERITKSRIFLSFRDSVSLFLLFFSSFFLRRKIQFFHSINFPLNYTSLSIINSILFLLQFKEMNGSRKVVLKSNSKQTQPFFFSIRNHLNHFVTIGMNGLEFSTTTRSIISIRIRTGASSSSPSIRKANVTTTTSLIRTSIAHLWTFSRNGRDSKHFPISTSRKRYTWTDSTKLAHFLNRVPEGTIVKYFNGLLWVTNYEWVLLWVSVTMSEWYCEWMILWVGNYVRVLLWADVIWQVH